MKPFKPYATGTKETMKYIGHNLKNMKRINNYKIVKRKEHYKLYVK